ncbi:glycosyltransferase [Aquimarina sp. U1-2]|uniref:glycosyltransferase n=1 Tax=Aquimarina sp. U1-2 TaxID=2823141 RepID=UPI001AEC77D0|nr:glycosyltransferase [Aquimarina sp. U1-2]MBP2832018.1 glycosyltransferase [Aquimarina sp. U1-2]
MKPILSIVIPVYNVSQYVEKCIRSICNQNFDTNTVEVIAVNDGSKDNSLEICERLQLEFTFLKIYSQENRGLSGARNTGLKNATGDYVWFIDSDDWIAENCIPEILQKVTKSNVDIFWMGHNVILNNEVIRAVVPRKTLEPVTGEEFFQTYLNNLFFIWKFIYRREFLLDNSLTFYEGILYEDLEFTPRALIKANTCLTLPKAYYNYLIRQGSIATNIKDKNIEDRFKILNKLQDLKDQPGINNNFKNTLNGIILNTFKGTVKMSAKAQLKLPELSYIDVKKLQVDKKLPLASRLEFYCMKSNLQWFYKTFQYSWQIYKKF